jgi:hypothetical protein
MISPEHDAIDEVYVLLDEYKQFLSGKAEGTTDAYLHTVQDPNMVWTTSGDRVWKPLTAPAAAEGNRLPRPPPPEQVHDKKPAGAG